MLHYNEAHDHGNHAHIAHAMVVSLHVLCCGLPAAFALTGAIVGVGMSVGMVELGGTINAVHAFLHGYELWVLALSALLVTIGAWAELRRPHRTKLPVLFIISVCCLFVNAAIIAGHRLAPSTASHEVVRTHA